MKVRNGFVSNSSSSSFIIISKNGDLTQEKLMKAFDISEKSPLGVSDMVYPFFNGALFAAITFGFLLIAKIIKNISKKNESSH